MVLDYVFSHVNLLESDYFGLRYCDLSHQTVSTDVPQHHPLSCSEFLHLFSEPLVYTLRDGCAQRVFKE